MAIKKNLPFLIFPINIIVHGAILLLFLQWANAIVLLKINKFCTFKLYLKTEKTFQLILKKTHKTNY